MMGVNDCFQFDISNLNNYLEIRAALFPLFGRHILYQIKTFVHCPKQN